MANFYGSDNVVWSEVHDNVPLKQRLKLQLANQRILECQSFDSSAMLNGVVVKKEYDRCISQDFHSDGASKKGKNGGYAVEQCPAGETKTEKFMSPSQHSVPVMTYGNDSGPRLPSLLSNSPVKVKVEQADDTALIALGNMANITSVTDKFVSPNHLSVLVMLNANDGRSCLPSMPSNFSGKVKAEQANDCETVKLENIVNSSSVTDKYASANQLSALEMINANDGFPHLPLTVSSFPAKVKVEQADDGAVSTLGNNVCSSDVQPIVKLKAGTSDDILDDLDHVVLKDRRRLLLSRKVSSSTAEVGKVNSSNFCNKAVRTTGQEITATGQCGSYAGDKVHSLAGSVDWIYSLDNTLSKFGQHGRSEPSSGSSKTVFGLGTKELVTVKIEPTYNTVLERKDKDSVERLPISNVVQVKTEFEFPHDSFKDKLDHMILCDRIKLLSSRDLCPLSLCGNSESLRKGPPLYLDSQPIASEYSKPLKIYRLRKRRKTATDSVGTALEEDAPGLLQVLVQKGVSVDEMKLYGQTEFDGNLDELPSDDGFSELEAVVSKLFSQRPSLLKLAPLRCHKGEKVSYCFTCLFSLVEQARYLRFRNWPVEWGWCRDLQSFIFVFERHNRIVLERPEYGYATYFFELVNSVSVDWQIKRLVTAMKLPSCSRVTLIENRALEIGEDLTEGEARVLMEYGWIPNTGLASMLNYRDRVVHDRKDEKYISDWRAKIGKLLMDGYNGGTLVTPDAPMTLAEYNVNQNPQIKLELS